MKLPPTLKVGALEYRLTDDPVELLQRCRANSEDLLGHCDRRQLVINIDDSQAPGQRRDSLLHEALHGVTDIVGLAAEWGGEREETIVARLTPALLALLRDNPKLVAYLTKGVKA